MFPACLKLGKRPWEIIKRVVTTEEAESRSGFFSPMAGFVHMFLHDHSAGGEMPVNKFHGLFESSARLSNERGHQLPDVPHIVCNL